MLEEDIAQLEERVQRLIAALEQARLERRTIARERDRLIAINAELRKRIEGVVERVKSLESEHES
jgi:cell division protein ZapB